MLLHPPTSNVFVPLTDLSDTVSPSFAVFALVAM